MQQRSEATKLSKIIFYLLETAASNISKTKIVFSNLAIKTSAKSYKIILPLRSCNIKIDKIFLKTTENYISKSSAKYNY